MKNVKKLVALGVILSLGLSLSACGTKEESKDSKQEMDMVNVGILQFAEHGSLDNCRQGFLEGLKEEGFEEGKNLTVTYENSQADTGIANQIASQFASKDLDLVSGIATPAAQALYNTASKKNIPVVYTAVSDPVLTGLAKEDGKGIGGVTGTSDLLPLEEQVKMIRAFMPEAKHLGVLYSTSEKNSESSIARLKEIAPKHGFELVEVGVNTASDIPQAVDNLLTKVDVINNLTDNLVVNNLDVLLDKANKKNIPVFGSEVEQVKKGCVAAMNIDYVALGKQTGKMAARVLKGEDINTIPFELIKDNTLVYNADVVKKFNMTLPQDMKGEAVN